MTGVAVILFLLALTQLYFAYLWALDFMDGNKWAIVVSALCVAAWAIFLFWAIDLAFFNLTTDGVPYILNGP